MSSLTVNKEQFRAFLIGLGYVQGSGFDDDVMYGDTFGNNWVYFSNLADKSTESNHYTFYFIVDTDEIDLAAFVLMALEAKEKQTWDARQY